MPGVRQLVGALVIVVAAATAVGPSGAGAASGARPGVTIASVPGVDLPDPFLVAAGGRYFMYLSTNVNDRTKNIPLLAGRPGHWKVAGDAMPKLPSWAQPVRDGGQTWAPEVFQVGDHWVMFSAPTLVDHRFQIPGDAPLPRVTHCIAVAVSSSPSGPFTPAGSKPIVCQTALGGDIDAQLFVDPQGPNGPSHPNYLIWKSDDNNLWPSSEHKPARREPTTIWAAPLSDDGLRLTGRPTRIFSPTRPWEQPILEAPQMVKAPDGTDWMIFSAGKGYYLPQYAMGAAACRGPLGGCADVLARPLISSNAQGDGPGEETVYETTDHQIWILYSPWHTGLEAVARPVVAAAVGWSDLGPFILDPPTFPPPG